MINMKRFFLTIALLPLIAFALSGQTSDSFVSSCVMNVGTNTKYLKDFRVELGKTSEQNELRYKTNISLWKNTKYRFTVCSAEGSEGELYLSLKDDSNRIVLTSHDKQTGRTFAFIDFVCNKSGVYQLSFDFIDGQQGSGVGVISIVK